MKVRIALREQSSLTQQHRSADNDRALKKEKMRKVLENRFCNSILYAKWLQRL